MQQLNNVLHGINDNLELISIGIVLLLGIIEKSKKLPFNPISKIFKWLRKGLRDEELYNKVDNIDKKLVELGNTNDIREMKRLRYEILEFERVLRSYKKNDIISQEQFMTIFDMITDYNKLVRMHKIHNNKFEKAKEYIDKKYNELYN